jgi:hypothetical protein
VRNAECGIDAGRISRVVINMATVISDGTAGWAALGRLRPVNGKARGTRREARVRAGEEVFATNEVSRP